MNSQTSHTYIGQIDNGVICYITINPQNFHDGGLFAVIFEWRGKPDVTKHYQKYLSFKREVFQDISNRSGKRIMDTSIMPNGEIVAYIYMPQQDASDALD